MRKMDRSSIFLVLCINAKNQDQFIKRGAFLLLSINACLFQGNVDKYNDLALG